MEDDQFEPMFTPARYYEFFGARLPFKNFRALTYQLTKRDANGLLECGAVAESPVGLLINPIKFRDWLLGKYPVKRRAA